MQHLMNENKPVPNFNSLSLFLCIEFVDIVLCLEDIAIYRRVASYCSSHAQSYQKQRRALSCFPRTTVIWKRRFFLCVGNVLRKLLHVCIYIYHGAVYEYIYGIPHGGKCPRLMTLKNSHD